MKLYKPDVSRMLAEFVKLSGILLVTAYCFYNSVWGLPVGIPLAVYVFKRDCRTYRRRSAEKFLEGFRDMMQFIDSGINAGYSLENAFIEAGRECVRRGGDYLILQSEFLYIKNGLGFNRNIEDLLLEVGERHRSTEITELAGLINIAKQHGGDISSLIRQFNQNISRRKMLEQELDTMMTAKRFEGMIMVTMPYLIIFYMRLTTPGYMDVLYELLIGKLAMTGSFIVTTAALVIMNKIVDASALIGESV